MEEAEGYTDRKADTTSDLSSGGTEAKETKGEQKSRHRIEHHGERTATAR